MPHAPPEGNVGDIPVRMRVMRQRPEVVLWAMQSHEKLRAMMDDARARERRVRDSKRFRPGSSQVSGNSLFAHRQYRVAVERAVHVHEFVASAVFTRNLLAMIVQLKFHTCSIFDVGGDYDVSVGPGLKLAYIVDPIVPYEVWKARVMHTYDVSALHAGCQSRVRVFGLGRLTFNAYFALVRSELFRPFVEYRHSVMPDALAPSWYRSFTTPARDPVWFVHAAVPGLYATLCGAMASLPLGRCERLKGVLSAPCRSLPVEVQLWIYAMMIHGETLDFCFEAQCPHMAGLSCITVVAHDVRFPVDAFPSLEVALMRVRSCREVGEILYVRSLPLSGRGLDGCRVHMFVYRASRTYCGRLGVSLPVSADVGQYHRFV